MKKHVDFLTWPRSGTWLSVSAVKQLNKQLKQLKFIPKNRNTPSQRKFFFFFVVFVGSLRAVVHLTAAYRSGRGTAGSLYTTIQKEIVVFTRLLGNCLFIYWVFDSCSYELLYKLRYAIKKIWGAFKIGCNWFII